MFRLSVTEILFMLQTIRDRASGWFAYLVFGMLLIPFALWGINYYTHDGTAPFVARVNGEEIGLARYQQTLQNQRERLRQGGVQDVDENRLKHMIVGQLIDERLLEQFTRAEHMRAGNVQVSAWVQSVEAFRAGDRFDPETYQAVLRRQGYTVTDFENMLRTSLATDQLRQGLAATALLSTTDRSRLIELVAQKRDFEVLTLALAPVSARQSVDDAAIEARFRAQPQAYVFPEQLRLEVLDLSPDLLLSRVGTPQDADLRGLYTQQQASLGRPETRTASHILVRVPDGASPGQVEQAHQQALGYRETVVSGKESFEALGKSLAGTANVEVGDLGALERGVMDPAFDQALFGLGKVGDLSEPVRTDFGFHVIRLDAVTPGSVPPFEEVRAQLVQLWQRQQAESAFFDAADRLSTLVFENPDNLSTAARELGLQTRTSDWLTRSGSDDPLLNDARVLAAAFSDEVLKDGRNSEPVQLDAQHVIVVRVAEHRDAKPKTLAEAREQIVAELKDSQARAELAKAAEQLMQAVRDGTAPEAAAQAAGATRQAPGPLTRNAAVLTPELLRAAFRVPPPAGSQPALSVLELASGDRAVIVLKSVQPGTEADVAEADRQALTQRAALQSGERDFRGLLDALRAAAKIENRADPL